MSKIKNGALEQYGTEPFEQQQFETAGIERVKIKNDITSYIALLCIMLQNFSEMLT